MLELLLLLLCPFFSRSDPLPYAEWAHYHMIWAPSGSYTNQVDIQNMFDDYTAYRIPFGSINIDSGWATNYNTFIFDTTKFPTFRAMLDGFRARNTRIILWMTSMINVGSPNYPYAQEHGYLFNKTIKWWHGEGRLLDYFNEEAVSWWHSQIERLVDAAGPIHAFKV